MNYATPAFVFFAAFGALFYHFLPEKLRQGYLIVLSVIWGMTWKVEWTILYLLLLNFNFFAMKILREKFGFLVAFNVVIFVLLKTDLVLPHDLLHPFGLSFFFFMMLGLMIDHWRKQNTYSWQQFMLLPIFFPLLMSGPLERGKHFFESLKKDNSKIFSNINDGITLIVLGFLKNIFLFPRLTDMANHFVHLPMTIGSLVIAGFLETFKVYIELSSYADIGRGVAKLFGIDLFVNWRPFYMAKNPNDFWARWNITLGTWIRDYFSFPMMLRFGRKVNQHLLLFFSFVLVGLWHSIDLVWLKFGVFNGIVLVIYNVLNRWIKIGLFGRMFAFIIIIGNGLVLRSAELPPKLFEYFTTQFAFYPEMISDFYYFIAAIGLVVFIELVEEFRGDHDWFFKTPLWLRTLVSCVLIAVFIWVLDMELFDRVEKMGQLPIYFKI